MSRYTYAGTFKNPTENFVVRENPDDTTGGYIIGVTISDGEILTLLIDGEITPEEASMLRVTGYRPHTNGQVFQEQEDADKWISNLEEFFEEDYDSYLEENSHEICQMERYEQWRNEY